MKNKENIKIITGIIIIAILIIGLVSISLFYSKFNKEQLNKLTEESNKLLEMDFTTEEINNEIKTKKNFAIVEKSIKEYLTKLQKIYKDMNEMSLAINPNEIFIAKKIEDKDFKEIDDLINDHKNNAEQLFNEYKILIEENNIKNFINEKNFSKNREYYIELYNSVMLNDVMKESYNILENKIEKRKDVFLDKLNKVKDIKKFLEENKKYWNIKNEKIQFTNVNIMTEYYELINELVEE